MLNQNFKVSYKDDIKLFQTKFVKFWLGAFVLASLVYPNVVDQYFLYLANLSMIAIIAAIGLNMLVGYTGIISIGHAAFLAIGAYSCAILMARLHVPFLLSVVVAGCIAALAGLVVAIPSLRLKGLYIAITTFAFGFIVQHFIVRCESLTGGPDGLSVPTPDLFGFPLDSDTRFFYFLFAVTVVLTVFARNLFRTGFGRALIAIRDHDIAAEIMGIELARHKIISFCISSFYAGIAGALFAAYLKFITFEHFTLRLSIDYLAMIVVGGIGSILGSIYGAVFITLLPEAIRMLTDTVREDFPLLTTRFAALKTVISGMIIVIFLLYEPDGMYGRWQKIKTYWNNWPFTY